MHDNTLAVDVREAARRLSLSPRTVATLISLGELPSRMVGRRRIIPVLALETFIRRDHPTGDDTPGKHRCVNWQNRRQDKEHK